VNDTGQPRDPADFDREIGRLRQEVHHAHAVSAAALSRATRLAQLVSSLSPLTDPQEILDRAAYEVAEQFGADVAAFLTRAESSREQHSADTSLALTAHWGIPDRSLPDTIEDPPAYVATIGPIQPLAGSADELGVPGWLRPSRPRHLVWAKLALRNEALGYMVLARRSDEPFSSADVKEFGLVVSRIALAVDNGRLYSRTQEQVRRLGRLHEVAAALAGTLDVERVVDSLATTVRNEVPVVGVAVYLAGKGGLELAAEAGLISRAPAEIANEDLHAWPDDNLILMGMGGPPVGALLLSGRPPAGSEADSFLQHLADLGNLTIGKSQLFERIRTQAESDPLTGLPNRTLLMGRLESALSLAREDGTDITLIFVDLDDFKSVNDSYGHDVGDQLLIAVAGRLLDLARPDDTVARLGGDEFVLMRADVDTEQAYVAAQHIRSAMATPFELGEVILVSEASVGLAMASSCHYHTKTLIREADASMYADKVRDHRARVEELPSTTRSRPRERGIALAARRRAARLSRPSVRVPASAPVRPPTGPASDNLRTWCDTWARRADRGIHGGAGESIQRILNTAREQLEMDLVWLSRFVNGRHIFEAFAGDPTRFRLNLDSDVALADSYCIRVLDGRLPSVLPDTAADERTAGLPVTKQFQLGAYVGVPVFVRRGELFGMLCAVSRGPEPSLRHRDAKLLRMLAGLLSEPLSASLAHGVQSSAFVRNATSMLDAGGMTVDLQPIIDLASGDVVSLEALARFAHYPYSVEGWFAQAHEAGCGPEMEIDAVVNAHRLLPRLPPHVTLAVNASPDVACSEALLEVVTGTDPARVVVEITEHRRASEPSMFAWAIRRLKGHGVQVAIDDAGTGYSDLRQILELQPDIVKLDRALIDGVDTDPVKMALVQALVAFGRDTGIQLIAEGVSSLSIRDAVRELQVDCGQGYALGRPEPAGLVLERL
jgi:diguanylate cyclase (GGDEF)-like protein